MEKMRTVGRIINECVMPAADACRIIDWRQFDKVAVLFQAQEVASLPAQLNTLINSGFSAEQLWPLARIGGNNPAIAELQTHCVVLQEAQRQEWRNVLLLNAETCFTQHGETATGLNDLLNHLNEQEWQVLLLTGQNHPLRVSESSVEPSRLRDGGCVYAVKACYYAVMLNAYHRAMEHAVSREEIWTRLITKKGWLRFSVAFPASPFSLSEDTVK